MCTEPVHSSCKFVIFKEFYPVLVKLSLSNHSLFYMGVMGLHPSVHRLVVTAEDQPEMDKDKTVLSSSHLSKKQSKDIDDLLLKFASIFSPEPGYTSVLRHDIVVDSPNPIHTPPYMLPKKWKEKV